MISPVRLYFRLAFALSWGLGGVGLLIGYCVPGSQPLSPSSPLYYLAGYSISIAGVALTARYEGRAGLRRLGKRVIPWRSPAHWYVSVVVGYVLLAAAAVQAARWFGSADVTLAAWSLSWNEVPRTIARDPGPLGEEFGWRGFALPQLLCRTSPLYATLLLGLVHAVWHLPLFFIPGMPQQQLSFPIFTLGVLSMAVFDTALYLHTRANLLLAILVHLMANLSGLAIGVGVFPFFAVSQAATAVVIITLGGLASHRLADCGSRNPRVS